MKQKLTIILIVLICLVTQIVESKVSKCKDVLNKYDKEFFYCTKFSVGLGQPFKSYYKARFTRSMEGLRDRNAAPGLKDRKVVLVTIAVYEHSAWQELLALKSPTCRQREELAFMVSRARVPLDGKAVEGYVTMTERNWLAPTMYYMAVMDCDDEIHGVLGQNRYGRVEVTASMTAGEDHFSYEKQGIITSDSLLLATFVFLFALNIKYMQVFFEKFDTRTSPHAYCLIAMALQCLGIICDLVHNLKYAQDGEGMLVFDVIGTILDMLSECVMTLLLLMMANGWMTRFQNYNLDDGLEIYAPLFMLVIMVHVMFGALSYVDQDAYHKYHDFHGWVGYGLIVVKFIIVMVFFYFYVNAKDQIKKQSQHFYQQVLTLGLLYLMSDPTIILTSFFLDEWNRQWYYRMADQLTHILTQAYFLYQMHNSKSSFTKSVEQFTALPE